MAEKSLDEIKADILNRAGRVNPFERVKREDVARNTRRSGRSKKKKEKRKKPVRLSIWRMSTTVSAVIPSQAARKR